MYNTHAHVAAFTNFLLILAGSEKTCETVSDQKPAKQCQRKTLRSSGQYTAWGVPGSDQLACGPLSGRQRKPTKNYVIQDFLFLDARLTASTNAIEAGAQRSTL